MKSTLIGTLLASTVLSASFADNHEGKALSLTRIASVPAGAEVTGLTTHGDSLFINYQHPNEENTAPYNVAAVGVINGFDQMASELALPEGDEKEMLMTSVGTYQMLVQPGQDGIGEIDGKASDSPDFNSFIATGETEGYLFSNWEERPGGMSRIALSKADDGKWTIGEKTMVDFSSVNGTWVNCFGTTSPWQTPLSSEELYFDDTADWNNAEYERHDDQLALQAHLGGTYPNPYDYGYIVEITDPTGTPTPVKHFTLGRMSHENAVVMPDNKTVYTSSDGTDQVFFKFIADEAGNLSAGTLYAAKLTQHRAPGISTMEASFDIEWIELAHGSNDEISAWVRSYDGITPDDFGTDKTYVTDEEIAAWAAGEAADNRAAFLESIKAAAAKGATAEFRKMEGVNINYDAVKDGSHPFMYMAMSNIGKGMSDNEGDIQLAENGCGAVFKMELDRDYNVSMMTTFVEGGPYDEAAAPNACAAGNISEPDNVIVLADGAVLIGEDTGEHENNMLWLAK